MPPSKLQAAVIDRLSLVEQTPDDAGSPPNLMDSAEINAKKANKANNEETRENNADNAETEDRETENTENTLTEQKTQTANLDGFNNGSKNIMRSENQPFLKPLPPLAPLLDFTQIGEQKIDSASDELRTSIFETKEQTLKQIQLFIASKRDEFETYLQLQDQEYNTIKQEESKLLQSATPTDIASAFADDPVIEEPVKHIYGSSHLSPPAPVYKHGRSPSGKHLYFYNSPLSPKRENSKRENSASSASSALQASQQPDDTDIGFEDLIGPTIGTEDRPNSNEHHSSTESRRRVYDQSEFEDKEEKPVMLALNGLNIEDTKRSSHVNAKSQDMSYLSSSKPMDIRPNPTLLEGDGGRPARTEAERKLENSTPLSFSQIQNLKQTDPSNMSFSQRMEWEQLGKVGLSQSVYD